MEVKEGMGNMSMRRVWLCFAVAALALAMAGIAQASVLDLTSAGASGYINGAYFLQVDPQSTGSGVIDPFVRLQANDFEQGYNTDYRPLQFNENSSATFTHSILVSAVPVVTIGTVDYLEFLLDINQNNSKPLLSLDKMEIYLLPTPDAHDYASFGTPVYTIDPAGQDNYIKLNYSLNPGSGAGDMFAYIPKSLFPNQNDYLYLYSRFGDTIPSNDGYEEWATVKESIVPEPASLITMIVGAVGGIGSLLRRRSA